MDFEAEARRDVEQTLREGRDDLERSVARGRLGLFGGLALVAGAAVALVLRHQFPLNLLPFGVFGVDTLYALAIWRAVQLSGERRWATLVTAHLDPLMIAASVVILRHAMPSPDGVGGEALPARFDIYGLAPMFALLGFLGTLRLRTRRVLYGAFVVAVYVAAIRLDVGRFEAPQVVAVAMIALGAIFGARTSDRIAEMLDRASRLSLLRRYLPESFAERVSSDSIDLAAALGAQSLDVTVLVSDLRGFTAMSEKLAPIEVVALLGAYHEQMLQSVEENGGVVDKFLGDGILVVFGLPGSATEKAADTGAAAAVRCAASMHQRLAKLNQSRIVGGQEPLGMGIGIHSGPVTAGTIGAGRRREFTVIGDTVNTASRLEALTKSAGAPVLLSAATVSRLGAEQAKTLRELEAMTVKGKSEPLRIYAMQGTSSPGAARGIVA